MTDNWDATIEPARVALEALIKRGDEMADYVQKLQTKVFLQEKHIWELEANLKTCEKYKDAYAQGDKIGTQAVRDLEAKLDRAIAALRRVDAWFDELEMYTAPDYHLAPALQEVKAILKEMDE